jgi:hypothetical protein
MEFQLYRLDRTLKRIVTAFLITLTCGLIVGLVYLNQTTRFSDEGTINSISGSQAASELEIPDYYSKTISELLITTHNHIIGFALIFFVIGGLLYFSSIIPDFWKSFLIIEPLISVVITFGSIWAIRFLHSSFVYLAIISSSLIYISYFVMVSIIIYELNFKKL